MPIYPTPRLLTILALSVLVALGVGIFAPGLWAWVPLVAALLFVAALLDGMFAPVAAGLAFTMKPPAVLGVGRTVDVPFEARFTKWRQPAMIELRLGLHRLLLTSTYERRLTRQDGAFHGTLNLKAMARGRGDIEAAYIRWRGFLGLVYVQTRVPLDSEIVVTPDLQGVEQEAADLFSLDNIYGA